MPGENAPQSESPSNPSTSRAPWASRVLDRGEDLTRKALAPVRPRISLASSSVLVLLTLLLPIGYQSCGPETKGYELLQGQGNWPTLLGILLSDYFGPAFYGVVLLLAAFTAIHALTSFLKPDLYPSRSLNNGLLVISGTVSLFLISDVLLLLAIIGGDTYYGGIAIALVTLSCLMPGMFWPKKIFWRWFGALVIPASILAASAALNWLHGDDPVWLVLCFAAVYVLVPLALWWRGLSARRKFDPEWVKIRKGLIAFYFPAAIGNLWFFFSAWQEGIWGFVPCWFGIHLMTLGYMRLAKEGEQAQASPPTISA